MNQNITLSADKRLIQEARKKAQKEKSSLNEKFRLWLNNYVGKSRVLQYEELMKELDYARSGGKLTRDEMNER